MHGAFLEFLTETGVPTDFRRFSQGISGVA